VKITDSGEAPEWDEPAALVKAWALAAAPHGIQESERPDRAKLDPACKRSSGSK